MMKHYTGEYGVFYKNRDKWVGPTFQETFTMEYLWDEYGSVEKFLKEVRKQFKKKVVLKEMVWE